MKINLIVVGKTNISWVEEAVKEYSGRLLHYVPFSITVIPDVKNAASLSVQSLKEKEGEAILKAIQQADEVILLDEKGKEFTSVEFAAKLQAWQTALGNRNLVFVVGGAFGFSQAVYDRSNGKISLSLMTFSHQMIRAIFVEQLYRAHTIIKGEKYHHV
ncbi:MAG: 23S rRNA (pseudouridine(1915)-N(3))-methyltransferase RlmH [Bacteroidales bacterium]|nr:23S rRNA (pseudouridine(1915)-N(3))-methyltransferase RlmH [Bacteroidales bacterium]